MHEDGHLQKNGKIRSFCKKKSGFFIKNFIKNSQPNGLPFSGIGEEKSS